MSIYSKPTKELMKEFAKNELKPNQIFDKKLAVDWFAKHYPDIRHTTVQMHVEGMAVNSGSRKHHPSIKSGSGHDLFLKVAPGRFRLWDPKIDPAPVYQDLADKNVDDPVGSPVIEDIEDTEEDDSLSREFAYERDLRNYLTKNLQSLEQDLKLYQDEGFTGVEFPVGGRFIDMLAVDARGNFVVVELKVSRGYDRVIGQLLRYMAWVRRNLADGKPVRGIIVASGITEDLRLAASLVPDVKLVEYKISFKLTPIDF